MEARPSWLAPNRAIERKVPGSQEFRFVDDVTWFVEGTIVEEVARGLKRCAEEREVARSLKRCAEESLAWAQGNAVRFETAKTEAILLSRRRSHGRAKRERGVVVDKVTVPFATTATWLGVWLDSALTLRESRRRSTNRARAAEASIRRMVSKHGLPSASARNLQNAIVSGTMLYAAAYIGWVQEGGREGPEDTNGWAGPRWGSGRPPPSALSRQRVTSPRPEPFWTFGRLASLYASRLTQRTGEARRF